MDITEKSIEQLGLLFHDLTGEKEQHQALAEQALQNMRIVSARIKELRDVELSKEDCAVKEDYKHKEVS